MHIPGLGVLVSLVAFAPLLVAQSLPVQNPGSAFDPAVHGGGALSSLDTTTVSGSLLGIDGYPIQNGEVHLQSLRNGTVLATAITGVAGTFQFTGVPSGDYEVVANKGVAEVRQRIHCVQGFDSITLRVDVPSGQEARTAGGDSISVTALRVPQKARDLFRKADAAFQKNKMPEAWKLVDKALAVCPTYSEALTLRGIMLVSKGDLAGGETNLQAAIKNDSNYPLAYFAMGALQNIESRFADAQRTLEEGLRVQPTSWQGYYELSKSMLGQSDYRSALKNIVRAESTGVNYPPIYLVKADVLMALKSYNEAATELQHYLEADPNGPRAVVARKALERARSFAETAEK